MKKVAFIGSGDSDLVERLFRPLILGKDCRVEGTFSFSIDHRSQFNEFARHLGVIVIMSNPIYRRWKQELLDALEDFSPDYIFDFSFDEEISDMGIRVWRVREYPPFVFIVSPEGRVKFWGDERGAISFLQGFLCGK